MNGDWGTETAAGIKDANMDGSYSSIGGKLIFVQIKKCVGVGGLFITVRNASNSCPSSIACFHYLLVSKRLTKAKVTNSIG